MKRDELFDPSGFSYDHETGEIWSGNRKVGSSCDRYRIVNRNGVRVAAHRLAWRLHFGAWPETELDHINGNKRDNRIANLRLATRSDNMCNAGCQRNSTTGVRGVHFAKSCSKWMVKVKKGATMVRATTSHSISAVVAARLIRRVLHGEFSYESSRSTHTCFNS